jgi:hypothetical protein
MENQEIINKEEGFDKEIPSGAATEGSAETAETPEGEQHPHKEHHGVLGFIHDNIIDKIVEKIEPFIDFESFTGHPHHYHESNLMTEEEAAQKAKEEAEKAEHHKPNILDWIGDKIDFNDGHFPLSGGETGAKEE